MTSILSEVFYWIFNMSISASIAGIVILLFGKLRQVPRRVIHVLWAVPLFRMCIPVGINSKYSLMSLIAKITSRTVTVYEGHVDFSMTNFTMAADTYFPLTYKIRQMYNIFKVSAVVWIIIAAALLIAIFIIYKVTKSELKGAELLYDNIYISDKVTSPATYGIFREKIIIPKVCKESDLNFVLLHERAHIKRKDNLWRIVGIVTACVHWFNPLSWLFLNSFLSNIELACDEAVLRKCGEDEKKNYATALLNCAESKNLYASSFGGSNVRLRIGHILSYKKLSALSMVFLIVMSAFIAYVLLTNAV